MHAVFIRHGESTSNVGLSASDVAKPELTEKGWEQARQLAAAWTETPSLIVVSPFLRTQQTARPTQERFPTVPVEQWEIEEFTYLEPSRWNGTARSERLPWIEAYWKAEDPDYLDGPGAESFANLLRRAEAALLRLRRLAGHANMVYLFSHGQFMQAVWVTLHCPEASDREKMHCFLHGSDLPGFQNAGFLQLDL
ncbi:MAG: histidine phosphatase family protein [Terracidiphilus sp.]